jgi:hypothetical protein
LEDPALIVELGRDNPSGHLQGKRHFERPLILSQPGQAMSIQGRQESTQEFTVPTEHIHGNGSAKKSRKGV